MITDTFDNDKTAVLNPSDLCADRKDMTYPVMSFFDEKLSRILLDMTGAVKTASLYAGEKIPVYLCRYKDTEFLFYRSIMGGPAAVSLLESALARGAFSVFYFGSCGSLDTAAESGTIILPDRAYRDEGTSYHYLPPSDCIDISSAERLETVLKKLKIPHIKTGTWTTDAIFRETSSLITRRKNDGFNVVEMECASLMAAAAFRNADVYQLLYRADCLDGEYDMGILRDDKDIRESLVITALECMAGLQEENDDN